MLFSKILPVFHKRLVLHQRVEILAHHLAELLPESGTVLDVGCGDGEISRMVVSKKPGLQFTGVEVLERPKCAIPMKLYDGRTLPFEDNRFDFVIFVDVLHHTDSPKAAMPISVTPVPSSRSFRVSVRGGL